MNKTDKADTAKQLQREYNDWIYFKEMPPKLSIKHY